MNEDIRRFFDEIAINYQHEDSKLIEELLDSLMLIKCERALDLGCGKGIISSKIADRCGGDVIALDLSSKMIELAKENIDNPKVHFINEDFYEFRYDKFDVIICFDAYPHFMDVDGFVEKANELLKDDGLLAIIHDCDRKELNHHHQLFASNISRMLKNPEEEAKPFYKYFKPIELSEGNSFYKMLFVKK